MPLLPLIGALVIGWFVVRPAFTGPSEPKPTEPPDPTPPTLSGWDSAAIARDFCSVMEAGGHIATIEAIAQAIATAQWPTIDGRTVIWRPTGPAMPAHPHAVELWRRLTTFVREALKDPDTVCVAEVGE